MRRDSTQSAACSQRQTRKRPRWWMRLREDVPRLACHLTSFT